MQITADPESATSPPMFESAAGRTPLLGIVRSVWRSLGFAAALAAAATDYAWGPGFRARLAPLRRRALWLQRWSRIVCQIIGLELRYTGHPPVAGMVVSNHLSYLDILAYSALVPCVFVAKKEVATWPILGLFARMAGTIFVDRTQRLKVGEANLQIAEALRTGIVVILFAEGTSSDGRTVLPFRSSLLEPAASSRCPLTPAAIGYTLDDGSVADEVCYWGDMTLLPHLLRLFTKRIVHARVAFAAAADEPFPVARKDAARKARDHVARLYFDVLRSSR